MFRTHMERGFLLSSIIFVTSLKLATLHSSRQSKNLSNSTTPVSLICNSCSRCAAVNHSDSGVVPCKCCFIEIDMFGPCNDNETDPHCPTCPLGTVRKSDGACSVCKAGTFAPTFDLISCIPCQLGHFCDHDGTINPKKCNKDQLCPGGTIKPEICVESWWRSKQSEVCRFSGWFMLLVTLAVFVVLLVPIIAIVVSDCRRASHLQQLGE